MSEIKWPVTVELIDGNCETVILDRNGEIVDIHPDTLENLLNAAPKRAFETLPGELWAIYKAAASAAEERAGDPGGIGDSSEGDYYERVLVEELEKRLQAFAAPKRAFEELTISALWQLLDRIKEGLGEYPSEGSTDDQVAWRNKADAAFLSGLKDFAAPVAPAWQPITVEAVNGKGFLLLMPTKTIAACEYPTVAQLIPSERSLGEFEWEEEGGTTYSFRCFSHFMPLPAAPVAQGGAEDA